MRNSQKKNKEKYHIQCYIVRFVSANHLVEGGLKLNKANYLQTVTTISFSIQYIKDLLLQLFTLMVTRCPIIPSTTTMF